ncbi:hypothetical protein QU868_13900, partial [Escherichia coli]|nr:hypothetical protein [Escherichia coli]
MFEIVRQRLQQRLPLLTGMLWAESRALLLMALQQQMVTPLSL